VKSGNRNGKNKPGGNTEPRPRLGRVRGTRGALEAQSRGHDRPTPSTRKLIVPQQARAARFACEFAPCRAQPDRRVNSSGFVLQCRYTCGSCKSNRRADWSARPAHRHNVNVRNFRKSMILRSRLSCRMRGLKLFERVTGFKLNGGGAADRFSLYIYDCLGYHIFHK
jgi:hypothetical protein